MKANFFMAGMAAFCLLASCVKETQDGKNTSGTTPQPGDMAVASFKVSLSGGSQGPRTLGSKTGNGQTDEGTAEEQKVSSLAILVFDKTSGTLAAVGEFTGAQLSQGKPMTARVSVPEGTYQAVAIANNPTAGGFTYEIPVDGTTSTTTLTNFLSQPITAAKVSDDKSRIELPIAQPGSMLMISPVSEDITVYADSENPVVALRLERLSSKVSLTFDKNTIKIDEENFEPSLADLGLTVADISFDSASYITGMLRPETSGKGAEWTPDISMVNFDLGDENNSGKIQWTDAATGAEGETSISLYVTENIQNSNASDDEALKPKWKNTTHILVKTKMSIAGITDTDTENNPNGSFWALVRFTTNNSDEHIYKNIVSPNGYHGIYSSYDDALNAKMDLVGEIGTDAAKYYGIVEFSAGEVAYRINLTDNTAADSRLMFSVLRNTFYQVSVSKISGIGWPVDRADELEDPTDDTPAEDKRVGIDAEVDVIPWRVVTQDEILQ